MSPILDVMPQQSPPPREENPGTWITRWRSDLVYGKRHQHTKRFYGSVKKVEKDYRRWLRQWRASYILQNPKSIKNLTIADLCVEYMDFASRWYVKNGRMTGHVWNVRVALQHLIEHYGNTDADSFTPPMLASMRDELDQHDAKRMTINKWITIIRQAYNWAAEKGHIDPDVALRLTTVKLLQKGRCKSAEYKIVIAVDWSVIESTIHHCSNTVAAMIKTQWHTGMRPGEVCVMRGSDIISTAAVWLYRPSEHKAEHFDIDRVVCLGPKAQEAIKPFLGRRLSDYLFSPHESAGISDTSKRSDMGQHFTTVSYRRAIHRACDRALHLPVELAPLVLETGKRESNARWWKRLTEDPRRQVNELRYKNR